MSRLHVFLLIALIFLPQPMYAQTCIGGAAFEDRIAQIGIGSSFSANARAVNGAFSIGAPHGPFAAVGLGTAHDDKLGDYASLFNATAGDALPLLATPNAQLCPFISASVLTGIDLPGGQKLSSEAFGLGLSVGTSLNSARGLQAVPFASAAVILQDATIHTPDAVLQGASQNYYGVSLGLGLIVHKTFMMRPLTTYTVMEGHVSRSYALQFAISFGDVPAPRRHVEGEGSLVSVWLNPRARVYYCPSSRWFGGTADGSFSTEREALAAGYEPEFGKRC